MIPIVTTIKPDTTTNDNFQRALNVTSSTITTRKRFINTPTMTTAMSDITTNNPQTGTSVETERTTLIAPIAKRCTSFECKAAASRILSMMDHSADPCEDFYAYACGGSGYKDFDEIWKLDGLGVLSSSMEDLSPDPTVKKFQDFYKSCIQYDNSFKYRERVKMVNKLLEDIGGFPDQVNATIYDITDLFAKLILRQSMPLFNVGIEAEHDMFILSLTSPNVQDTTFKMDIPNWSSWNSHLDNCLKQLKIDTKETIHEIYKRAYLNNCKKNYTLYLDYVENTMYELNIFSKLSDSERIMKIQEIRFDIEFQILDKVHLSPESKQRYVNREYTILTVLDLQKRFPLLQWKHLFHKLTNSTNIFDNTKIQVYLENLKELMTFTADAKLLNALLAMYANDLYQNTVIPRSRHLGEGDDHCLQLSRNLFPDIWSLIVATSVSLRNDYEEASKFTSDLFFALKNQSLSMFQKAEWIMEPSTFDSFVNKLERMELAMFSAPNEGDLRKKYDAVYVKGDYQSDLMELLQFHRQWIYSLQGTRVQKETIFSNFLDPLTLDLLTSYSCDTIWVPFGLIRKVTSYLPNYINVVRIGIHLAKAISTLFDPVSLKKIPFSPMEEEEIYKFKLESEVFPQYKNFSFEGLTIPEHNNGSLSINERISDNSAFELLLQYYFQVDNSEGAEVLPWMEEKSREQVIYLLTAQEFCKKYSLVDFMYQALESRNLPSPMRLDNIITYSSDFGIYFNTCSVGTDMNPMEPDYKYVFPAHIKTNNDPAYYNVN